MSTAAIPLLAALAALSLTACSPDRGPPGGASDAPGVKVLATVNGAAVTERDVEHRARRPGAMGAALAPDLAAAVLQTVVRDEVAYQKAVQLGLDRDPGFRVRLDDLEAQVRAFRRQEMAARLRAYAQQQATVGDDEARAWFDENAAALRTRFHVQQILHRGREAEILADREQLRAGAPFEEVAWRRFDGLPRDGHTPWDLGELTWYQLPPSWRGVVDRLEPGEISEVIHGEADRYWIVRLVGKRVDPAVSFATERERIVELLRARKAEQLHENLLADARRQASVVYAAGAAPPARTPPAPAP